MHERNQLNYLHPANAGMSAVKCRFYSCFTTACISKWRHIRIIEIRYRPEISNFIIIKTSLPSLVFFTYACSDFTISVTLLPLNFITLGIYISALFFKWSA